MSLKYRLRNKRLFVLFAASLVAIYLWLFLKNVNIRQTIQNDAVISFYFTNKPDPQRGVVYSDNDIVSYSNSWVESLSKLGLRGIIITNVQNATSSAQLSKYNIDIITIPTDTSVFINNVEQTTVDMKFFVAQEWLNAHKDQFRYLLITDLSDVTALHDPFPFFNGYDTALKERQLYVGSEIDGNLAWMKKYWWNCWQENIPQRYIHQPFYNPGILGGHVEVILDFLAAITIRIKEAKRIVADMSCDMQATWTALDKFEGRIFTGHPLHTKYKEFENPQNGILLKHK